MADVGVAHAVVVDRRSGLRHEWRTYWRLVGAKVRGDLQYRASFVLYLLAQAMVGAIDTVVILVVFSQVDQIGGWTRTEVLVLFGVSNLGFGLADLFVSQVELASTHIRAGTFDQFLLRPVRPLLQLSAHEFAPRRFGRCLSPIVVLAVALPGLAVDWSPTSIALLAATVVVSAAVFGSIWVITSSLSFWLIDSQEVANAFTYGGSYVGQYPLDIYEPWLQRIVVFVVPIAFTSYLPVSVVLGRPLPFGLPEAVGWAGPLVAALFAFVASRVWAIALRHHRSTGS